MTYMLWTRKPGDRWIAGTQGSLYELRQLWKVVEPQYVLPGSGLKITSVENDSLNLVYYA